MPFVTVDGGGLLYQPMAGADLRAARQELRLSKIQFGHLLGMTGENRNIHTTIKRYEEGRREVSPMVERLVTLLLWYKADFGYLPDLDRGERKPVLEPVAEVAL
jgi:transcriptional regulator with XRE-family HTH domain